MSAHKPGTDPSNILLLESSFSDDTDKACQDLMTVTNPADENVLLVTTKKSPNKQLFRWKNSIDASPNQVGIISLGGHVRSVSSTSNENSSSLSASPPTIETVAPDDLTGVGIKIMEFITQWEKEQPESSRLQLVICFDSLTTLLQYSDVQRVFRFLHVLTGRIEAKGGVAHYHLEADAHDSKTLATLNVLFDSVVDTANSQTA
ncbi:DUF7504 family protein [Haladaptatus sp. NG-SE-30]